MSTIKFSKETIDQRLFRIRKDKQLSQKDLADKFNVSRGYFSEVESGKKKPSIEILIGIVIHFRDIDPYWLLTGEGEMYNSIEEKNLVNHLENLTESQRQEIQTRIQEMLETNEIKETLKTLSEKIGK